MLRLHGWLNGWPVLTVLGIIFAATVGFALGCLRLAVDTMTDSRYARRLDKRLGPR
jgi:hypothetical protein